VDGSASQTFDIKITKNNTDNTHQEFHTQSTDGISVAGNTATDKLVLHGAGTFDLTLARSLKSIEYIDLQESAAQTVKLSLADLTLNGSSSLYIDGTSTDAVIFIGSSVSVNTNAVGGYSCYTINTTAATYDLLLQTGIQIAFTG
jgi:hypothetical protein